MTEGEIDVRRYGLALARNWQFLAVLALIGTLGGVYLALPGPPRLEARAGVAMIRSRVELNLDQRLRVLAAQDTTPGQSGVELRRNTLASLVRNPVLADRVADRAVAVLPKEYHDPEVLLGMVAADTPKGSEIVEIVVRGPDRTVLPELANLWADEFVGYVNELYAAPPPVDLLKREVQVAQDRYQEAEAVLARSIGESRINQLNQEIDARRMTIGILQGGQQLAFTTILTREIEARGEIVGTRLRSALAAASTPQTRQVQRQFDLLSHAYQAQWETRLLLDDARALQRQLRQSDDAATAGNALALLFLKMQAFAPRGGPGNLQVQINDTSQFSTSPAAVAADLGVLIATLERRQEELERAIDKESRELLANSGVLQDATGTVETNPLLGEAKQRARDLLDLRGIEDVVAQIAASSALDTARGRLNAEIQRLDRELAEEQARRAELVRARDLALEAYTTLARKLEETRITVQFPSAEVALARPATMSETKPSTGVPLPLVPLIALPGIGIVLLIALEIVIPGVRLPAFALPRRGSPSERRRTGRTGPAEATESAVVGPST